MVQFRYALHDIGKKKLHYVVLLLESILTFVLICAVLSVSFEMNDVKKRYDATLAGRQIYLLKDDTPDNMIDKILQDKNSVNKMAQLYDLIKGENRVYTAAPIGIAQKPVNNLDNSFFDPSTKTYDVLGIDANFFDVFGISVAAGRTFSKEDYDSTAAKIPVVLGYDYSKYMHLGQMFQDSNISYCVVGFLKQGASFFDPGRGRDIYSLDKYILKPIQENTYIKDGDIASFDGLLTHTFIITDTEMALQRIQLESNRLGLYTYDYISFSDQMKYIMDDFGTQIKLTGLLLFVVLIFTILAIISSVIQFIEQSTKEFSIHLLCGANQKDIVQRISFQMLFMLLAANIVDFIVFRLRPAAFFTLFLSILIYSLIIFIATHKFRHTELNDILRRSE